MVTTAAVATVLKERCHQMDWPFFGTNEDSNVIRVAISTASIGPLVTQSDGEKRWIFMFFLLIFFFENILDEDKMSLRKSFIVSPSLSKLLRGKSSHRLGGIFP